MYYMGNRTREILGPNVEADTLREIESISMAIKILDKASRETCRGPLPIWLKIAHAKRMLEGRLGKLIAEPEETDFLPIALVGTPATDDRPSETQVA